MSRTNIVIDDQLIGDAMRMTGARTKREAVEIALRHLVEQGRAHAALLKARGKYAWEGDIHRWRRSRT